MDLDILPGDIRVTQEAVAHFDFFIPEGFFGRIEHHPMFIWLLALENIISEIQKIHIEVKFYLLHPQFCCISKLKDEFLPTRRELRRIRVNG